MAARGAGSCAGQFEQQRNLGWKVDLQGFDALHQGVSGEVAVIASDKTGQPIDAPALRAAMTEAFGASDAEGAWGWKDAYEACEAALVLFVLRYGVALRARPAASRLAMLTKVAALLPSQTRRSEESKSFQQFSTPVERRRGYLQTLLTTRELPPGTALEVAGEPGTIAEVDDYLWEVYVPEPKRRWGYYVLPVFYGDRFVARFDSRLRAGVWEVYRWHWEPDVTPDAAMLGALTEAVRRFRAYLGAETLKLPTGLPKASRGHYSSLVAVRSSPAKEA